MGKRAAVAAVMLLPVLAYGALHANPSPLFAHQMKVGTVVLHARAPFPPNTEALLNDVEARLQKSAFYRADEAHHVFLCDTPALYAFFSPHHPSSGGETYFWLNNVVFLRPADVASNRLFSPEGNPLPDPRTLVYFITHELVHAQTSDALGLKKYLSMKRWQEDGYPDFIANPTFDADDALTKLKAGDASLDPAKSGLYLRYQLLVTHALKTMTPEELLSEPRDEAEWLSAVQR